MSRRGVRPPTLHLSCERQCENATPSRRRFTHLDSSSPDAHCSAQIRQFSGEAMPKTIQHKVSFRASPETLFNIYLSSRKHAAATGAKEIGRASCRERV